MEGAEPLPRRSLSVLPKLTTVLPLITKRAQHPKNTQKRLFRQNEELSGFGQLLLFYEQYNVYFAALKVSAGLLRSPSQSKIATRFAKGSPWMGPSFTPMDQDPRGPWTRCQKNVVSSLREMPANAVWPANIFLAIACDSVTQAVSPAPPCVRPFVKRTVFGTLTGRLESLYCLRKYKNRRWRYNDEGTWAD